MIVWIEVQVDMVGDMVRGGFREFEFDMDEPAFLERKFVGFGMDRYW